MASTGDIVLSPDSTVVSISPSDKAGITVAKVSSSAVKVAASNAVVVPPSADARSPTVLSHGTKEQNVKIRVCQKSTPKGEFIPPAWTEEGKVSDTYLTLACKYEEKNLSLTAKAENKVLQKDTLTAKIEGSKTSTLTDSNKPVEYFARLLESDQELKNLHDFHIHRESKSMNFDAIAKTLGPDESVVRRIMCKAIINTPSMGLDVVGDCWLIMTEIPSPDRASKLRRIYFFQVHMVSIY